MKHHYLEKVIRHTGRDCYPDVCLISKFEKFQLNSLKDFLIFSQKKTKSWIASIITDFSMTKYAFTLAEVLITLGIIGVVAALTLPSLIANHQKKSLEAAFKKSYSALQQAMVSVQPELLTTLTGDDLHGGENNTEFYTALFSKFNLADDMNKNGVYTAGNIYKKVLTYNNTQVAIPGCPQIPQKITADGSAVGGMFNCYANWIVIDTNGPRKKPNAMGQDLFYFGIDSKGKLIPLGEGSYSFWNFANQQTFCSKNSTNEQNGIGCTKYAAANECPDDKTKTYWECLPR